MGFCFCALFSNIFLKYSKKVWGGGTLQGVRGWEFALSAAMGKNGNISFTNNCSSKKNIYFLEKTSFDILCELSAWQTIHIKCQNVKTFFPEIYKKKIKILECRLLPIWLGAL